jgi:uncharacterized coiled-coil protein SlyX
MSNRLRPTASRFTPTSPRQDGTAHQGSSPITYLEARVLNLEEKQADLHEHVDALKELCHVISSTVNNMNKGSRAVRAGPSQDINAIEASLQNAKQFSMDLEKLKEEVHGSIDSNSDDTAKKSIPPHARGKKTDNE